jgi:FlaA1/EpsC-like NDP-sugar epimerase
MKLLKTLLSKIRTPSVAFAHDLAMVPVAWFGAYFLRFNLELPPDSFLVSAVTALPAVCAVHALMFWYIGLYRGVWRFASMPDLIRITKAVFFAVGLSAIALFLATRMEGIPRAVFPLHGVLLVLLLGGPRFAYRWFKDHRFTAVGDKKVLIVGAGRSAEMLVRDMIRVAGGPYQPIGYVDDDVVQDGREVHGIPVLGTYDRLPELVREHGVELVLIAIPTATSKQLRRVVELCERAGVPFRILPRLQDLVTGQVSFKELRDVRIEDLLGREPVTLDWKGIAGLTNEKTIMVTGGGGSIGAELCRQIARLGPTCLVLFERSEHNLYQIEMELRAEFPALRLVPLLGDVCDVVAVEDAFRRYAPHSVFHAAAYKHVPLLEDQLRQAVLNNVAGTHVVAGFADKYDSESFVLISSDKAVNPANVMGATKRVAEIVCQDLSQRSRTRFITVRFGNVLGSSGSVVPLFQQQIARGGPVTVTHPDIMRYFMTIPEASQLILQASAIGNGGEIFVLDMGEPVKITYLAEQLIRLSGKRLGEDVEIVYTGLRPGEKLYEELFHGAEKLGHTSHPKILLAHCRQLETRLVQETITAIERAAAVNDIADMNRLLNLLVPEHKDTASIPSPDHTGVAL